MVAITVNGVRHEIQSPADTPLLYVLRNDLELTGPQFGCGLSQCGACSVLVEGKEVRSCTMPLSVVADKEITTLEGLPARWAKQQGLSSDTARKTLHPIQQAWIEEQTPLCGFCQNGMMIKATELLESNAAPTVPEIKAAFTTDGASPHLCRCGSYTAIIQAVQHASTLMAKGGK
jgi:aerobic-type carbon monoxide dehydrogenase small subunit (CoxS/CutS family)